MNENDFNKITMFEKIESAEAFKQYTVKANKAYTLLIIFSIIAIIAGFCISVVFGIIAIVLSLIVKSIISSRLKPYRDIYLTALRNDKIRHEEKVRFLERQRLNSIINKIPPKPPTTKQIKQSLETEKILNDLDNK